MTTLVEFARVNILDLPHDLLLNCLARVSRLYYPTLCLVSKRFRSLITSLELYQTRTLLGRTESCLYLCLSFNHNSKQCWYTLCKRPTPSPNPKPNSISGWFSPCFRPYRIPKSSNYHHMVHVPAHKVSPWSLWTCAAMSSLIYAFEISISGEFSSRIFFLDCRSHTLHEAPSMQTTRKYPLTWVTNGKVYVVEGSNVPGSSDSMEVFDLKKQIWEHLPCPRAEILGQCHTLGSLAVDGKLYLCGDKNMVYKADENKWDVVGFDTRLGWAPYSSCVIDNIMYNYSLYTMFQWYDSKGMLWRDLKGLEELPKIPKSSCARVSLVNHGGKIAVLWDKKVRGFDSSEKNIWCAVIAVERRSELEVYGKLEWCEVVLKVPKSCCLVKFLAVDV